jgi:hypothetical protein
MVSDLEKSSYLPLGVVTVSFVGLSSYLMFVGLYCSALSLSEDIRLRQSIRKSTVEQSKLLDSIGTVHMEQGYIKKSIEDSERPIR